MKTKICSKCHTQKTIENFCHTTHEKDGFDIWCRECKHNYYESTKNIPKFKRKRKEWNLKNREARLKYNKNYHKNNTDKFKDNKLKNCFNIRINEYNQMLKEQNGVCAICGAFETRVDKRTNKIRSLAVDHNHKTGKVRGLLCTNCNLGLGLFKHNKDILILASKYLRIQGE